MPTEAEMRAQIITEARQYIGAHYLAGVFGAIPNVLDDYAPDRNISLVLGDWNWQSLAVCTAENPSYKGRRLRCCGRYAVPEVRGSRLAQPIWARHRSAPPPGDFSTWLARARGAREYQSPPLYDQPTMITSRTGPYQGHLYPRRHCFINHGDNENPDIMYLGEDCTGKRHFDCVGFVCRVLGRVLGHIRYGLPGSQGVGNWSGCGESHQGSMESCLRASPGDIFMSSSHMALVYERTSSQIRLIHADGDSRGVEVTNFADPSRTHHTPWGTNFNVIYLSRQYLHASDAAA